MIGRFSAAVSSAQTVRCGSAWLVMPNGEGPRSSYRESRATDLEELTKVFYPVEGQVGFVAGIGDGVAGLEAIGRPDVFEADTRALLRSYAIDAEGAVLVRKLEEWPARGSTGLKSQAAHSPTKGSST